MILDVTPLEMTNVVTPWTMLHASLRALSMKSIIKGIRCDPCGDGMYFIRLSDILDRDDPVRSAMHFAQGLPP